MAKTIFTAETLWKNFKKYDIFSSQNLRRILVWVDWLMIGAKPVFTAKTAPKHFKKKTNIYGVKSIIDIYGVKLTFKWMIGYIMFCDPGVVWKSLSEVTV